MLEQKLERIEIGQMLQEIAGTDPGSGWVRQLLARGWKIRYGKPLGGAAFTYSWRVITLRRGFSYRRTRGMLAHELVHAALYGGAWANSIHQEFVAEYWEARISAQLGAIDRGRWEEWFGDEALSLEQHYERIAGYTPWHRDSLPREQPAGLKALVVALWQGMTFWKTRAR